jgi:hypothetical protein
MAAYSETCKYWELDGAEPKGPKTGPILRATSSARGRIRVAVLLCKFSNIFKSYVEGRMKLMHGA